MNKKSLLVILSAFLFICFLGQNYYVYREHEKFYYSHFYKISQYETELEKIFKREFETLTPEELRKKVVSNSEYTQLYSDKELKKVVQEICDYADRRVVSVSRIIRHIHYCIRVNRKFGIPLPYSTVVEGEKII